MNRLEKTVGEVGSKVNRLIEGCHMTDPVNMLHGDLDHKVGLQYGGLRESWLDRVEKHSMLG